MTRKEHIYAQAFQSLPEGQAADEGLSDEIKEYLQNVILPVQNRAELEDLVYAGSSYGQKSGFVSGFRYAVALLAESLV